MGVQSGDDGPCGCKVGRLIESYELSGMNQQLVEWWSAEDGRSLRDMARHLNEELLRMELTRQGHSPLQGEVQNTYSLLTGDDVSRGMRTQTIKRLEGQGVDVDRVLDDFVSHQAVYRHLKTCLDEEYTGRVLDTEERREKSKQRVFALENRTEKVTEDTLERLRKWDMLELEGFTVRVDVAVTCSNCGRQHTIDDLLESGGCQCQLSAEL